MTTPYCIILTTAGTQAEAEQLAEMLVTRRLAACVQMIPMASRYVWNGELQKDSEVLLLVKTSAELYPQVEAALLENHSYAVPEIIQLPVSQGLEGYLGWIGESVRPE